MFGRKPLAPFFCVALTATSAGALPFGPPLPPSRPAAFAAQPPEADVPLPPWRPAHFGDEAPAGAEPASPLSPPGAVQERPETVAMCAALQTSGRTEIEPVAPLKDGACGIEHPVKLHAVRLDNEKIVQLNPAPTMRCDMAGAVADWIRRDLAPKAVETGSTLKAVTNLDSYNCRGRNHSTGGKLSEHAKGNALDVEALVLADGRSITVAKDGRTPLMQAAKASACERFATVLGPGSDGFHENHVHVDLAPRRHGTRLCHWDEPPVQQSARP